MKRHLQLLLAGLHDRGLSVTLAGSGIDLDVPGLSFHSVGILDGVNPVKDVSAIVRLRRLLGTNRWSLVHAHGWKAGMITVVARCPLVRPLMVLTLHNELSPRFGGWRRKIMEMALHLPLMSSSAVVCVSTPLNRLIREWGGVPSEKLITILNGVDLSEIGTTRSCRSTLDRMGVPQGRPVVGTVARLIPEKGISDLLQAFSIVRRDGVDACLVVVGDGPDRADFVSQASVLGVSGDVSFLGWQDDAQSFMRCFDVFVLSSWSEGTPLSVMEAMAAGVPVIVTGVGGLRDLVEHMRTGVMVDARSPRDLATAIKTLLKNSALRARLSGAALDHARRSFSHTVMVDKTIEVYESVMRQTTRTP